MKKVLSAVIFLLISLTAMAVPADRSPRTVRLTDGSMVTVYLIGDEHYSWLQTADGIIVEQVAPDLYQRTERRVEEEMEMAAAERSRTARMSPRRIGSQATAPLPSKGSPRVPVILVNFTDSVFTVGDTPEEINHYYDLYCNGTRDGNRYTGHGSYGSIRDYFYDQSEGQFSPEFTIYGPVTVSHEESYYGENPSKTSHDKNYNAFVREAIELASNAYNIDWTQFDNKGGGKVDMVFLIFAGTGENTSGIEGNIWPNERSIGTVSIGNGRSVTFVCSGCCSERAMRSRKVDDAQVPYVVPDGIGVMCHELSHALGLPDFYDTNYLAYGMDLWSLMDYGCYAGNGNVPCAYTAYERDFMGWRPLIDLTTPGEYTLDPIANGGSGYKITNEANHNEYYILENRQKVNWDRSLGSMGHGLQVTHVDYDATCWKYNQVNIITKHQRMTVIAANNTYNGSTALQNEECTIAEMRESWAGTLYPYVKDGVVMNDSLTAHSTPAATVFTSSHFMNQDLHAIRENDDQTVTFYFGNDYEDAIRGLASSPAGNRQIYDLTGRPVNGSSPLRKGIYIQNGRKRLIR